MRLQYQGQTIVTNWDGSQDEGGSLTTMSSEFFGPFSGGTGTARTDGRRDRHQ